MTISIEINIPNLNPYSKRQYNADVFCECCGRGIPNRETAQVAKMITLVGNVATFAPIVWENVKGQDSVEWGGFVGSTCAKRIPKGYKISQKKIAKHLF